MTIRIGAFGATETIEDLQVFVEEREDIRIIPFTYQHPKETETLVQQAYGCDVFLFTGPIPYMYAQEALKKINVPHVFVEFDQLMISNAFNLVYQGEQTHIHDTSIDIMRKEDVHEVLEVLNIPQDALPIFDFSDQEPFEIAEIVQFHERLWNESQATYALTSIIAVEEQLKEKGIPCLKMPIPQKNVELALQEAKTLGELRVSQTAKIVVGFVKMKQMEAHVDEMDDFQFEKMQLTLHQILLRFTHEMDLSLYKGNTNFVIFGTQGSLDNLVSNNNLHEYIREIERTLNIHIVIGFGSGKSAPEAEENAKIAMRRALTEEESSCYVYDDSGNYMYVPSYPGTHSERETLISRVMKTEAVTLESATTFVEFLLLRDFNPFTTHEYATYSKVTTRTAARMIKKLVESGLLELAGEQKLYEKGRPRTMYQLKERTT